MRVWIIALSVLAIFPGILVGTGAATAGPSSTPCAAMAPADPATLTDEATRESEDQISSKNAATYSAG